MTIFASGGFGLLQMVSEPDMKCSLEGSFLSEAFFIRVWFSLPSIRILKTLRESPKKTISASGGLEMLHKTRENCIYVPNN